MNTYMKKLFAWTLCFAMCLSFLPAPAYAEGVQAEASEEAEAGEIISISEKEEDKSVEIPMPVDTDTVEIISDTSDYSAIDSGECGAEGDNLIWTLDDQGCLTISGTGKMWDWFYPETAPWYAHSAEIKNVVIQDGVNSIGYRAFFDCRALTTITIPASVTTIEYGAYHNCVSLTDIFFGGTRRQWMWTNIDPFLGRWHFDENTVAVHYAAPVEKVACGSCGKTEQDDITWTLYSDGGLLVYGRGGQAVMKDYNRNTAPWHEYRDQILYLNVHRVHTIGECAFAVCTNLTDLLIDGALHRIGSYAFWDCKSLPSIMIYPSSIDGHNQNESYTFESIGPYAFSGCSSLSEVTIPYVLQIGIFAFKDCRSLVSLSLPVWVNTIGYGVFTGCESLVDLNIHNKFSVEDGVLYDNTSNALICCLMTKTGACAIKNGTVEIKDYAFYNCAGLTDIEIPDSVKQIGSDAFFGCTGLSELMIPNAVTRIGNGAFMHCTGLQSITIPDRVYSIGRFAFSGCSNLENVTIPASVTDMDIDIFGNCPKLKTAGPFGGDYNIKFCWTDGIPEYAFYDSKQLTEVTIPEDISNIGAYAFYNCYKLEIIRLPASLTSVGNYAFKDCRALSDVYYGGTEEMKNSLTDNGWSTVSNDPFFNAIWHFPLVNPFADVSEGKYYYDAVLWAYYHDPQVTGGVDETHFGPNQTCTRAQIVTFLWKAGGAPEPERTENPFTDVKEDKYYYKAVLWAVENGITSGIGDGKFGVNDPCTREQAMTFLWKACGAPEPVTAENPFTDVKAGKYYFKAVLWAVENGITSGVSADKFGVGQTCTRAQIMTFLYGAMGRPWDNDLPIR